MKKFFVPLVALSLAASLAGCSALGVGGSDYGPDDAAEGAAFRVEAFEAFAKLNPVCPFTADAGQLERYQAPAARYQAVKDWVADTPFIVDMAIVEANYQHYWTVNKAECGAVDTEQSLAQLDGELNALNQRLDNLEKLAGVI